MQGLKQFKHLIQSVNPGNLAVSAYYKSYFKKQLAQPDYQLYVLNEILETAASQLNKPIEGATLVDFGGGTGLMSQLAKFKGWAKVVYLDIYDVATKDAQSLAQATGFEADEYLTGGLADLHSVPDALVSMDVIEHIFDLKQFFDTAFGLNPNLIQVHVTGANTYNPLVRRKLMKMQYQNEFEDRPFGEDSKLRDEHRAFFHVRKEWVVKHYGNVYTEKEITEIATNSRGLTFDKLRDLLNNAQIPNPPKHPSNTCDPHTGNWSERLLTQKDLNNFLSDTNWKTRYKTLKYNTYNKSGIKHWIVKITNFLLTLSGHKLKQMAGLICVVVKK
jgi:hypothetical protein